MKGAIGETRVHVVNKKWAYLPDTQMTQIIIFYKRKKISNIKIKINQ